MSDNQSMQDMIEQYKSQLSAYRNRSQTASQESFTQTHMQATTPQPDVAFLQSAANELGTVTNANTTINLDMQPTGAPDDTMAEFLTENPKIGYVKLQIGAGRGSLPISGATITISKQIEDKQYIFATRLTDQDGMTDPIELPTKDKALSESPKAAGIKPYTTYDITITYPNYKTVINRNVPIFEGIIAIQPVNMEPIIPGENITQQIIFEREPNLL